MGGGLADGHRPSIWPQAAAVSGLFMSVGGMALLHVSPRQDVGACVRVKGRANRGCDLLNCRRLLPQTSVSSVHAPVYGCDSISISPVLTGNIFFQSNSIDVTQEGYPWAEVYYNWLADTYLNIVSIFNGWSVKMGEMLWYYTLS